MINNLMSLSKLRFVENHDQPRAYESCKGNIEAIKAWTAFAIFNAGPFLLFSGQESIAKHKPTLFERDEITWGGYELTDFFKTLFRIKKNTSGTLAYLTDKPLTATWYNYKAGTGIYGIFLENSETTEVKVSPVPDGGYKDFLSGQEIVVSGGKTSVSTLTIFEYSGEKLCFEAISSSLFPHRK
jgi:hypothetical protein